jgi:tetratricopeptide (TPR) repeat protein
MPSLAARVITFTAAVLLMLGPTVGPATGQTPTEPEQPLVEERPALEPEPAPAQHTTRPASPLVEELPALEPEPAPAQSTTLPQPRTPAEKVHRGFELLEQNNAAEALKLFKSALEEDAELAEALLGAGDAMRRLEQRYDAIDYYNKYLATTEGRADWRGYFGMGLTYMSFEYYRLAKPTLLTAYRLAPKDKWVEILLNLANAHRGLKELKEAVSCGETALTLDPDNALVHQVLATLYTDLETADGYRQAITHADRALQLIRQAFDKDPGNLQLLAQFDLLYTQVAGIYQKQIQARAGELVASGITRIQTDARLSQLTVELARTMVQAAGIKRTTAVWRAVAVARQAVKLCPERSDAHYQLAQLLALVGQFQEALGAVEKAVELRPTDQDAILPSMEEMQYLRARLQEQLTTSRPAAPERIEEIAPEAAPAP